MSASYDQEKDASADLQSASAYDAQVAYRSEAPPEHAIAARYGPAQAFFKKLFALGVEARGVERVPEDERTDRNSLNSLFLWFSVNTVLTTRMHSFADYVERLLC